MKKDYLYHGSPVKKDMFMFLINLNLNMQWVLNGYAMKKLFLIV